ncbi:MAG: cyclase family protein [Woeseiaceae bacterium]|nr:cyclase family protein [Woeseiaceae bacterium]
MSHRIQTPDFLSIGALITAALFLVACEAPQQQATDDAISPEMSVTKLSMDIVPGGPWGDGDQLGMANTLGAGTWMRCAHYLTAEGAQSYELSHVRSNDMTQSPFGVPLVYEYRPTVGIPFTRHAFNGEQVVSGEPGAQGTQMDALGHFAYLDEAWTGEGDFPADGARYYGGYGQAEVKPTPDSPLLKLGIENVPPIITSAVLLDARAHLGGGEPLPAGRAITAADIDSMLEAQGLGWRGILPGDVLYIYTGWSDIWEDDEYYTKGPGLANDALAYIEERKVVLVALDNPFTDPVNEGQLTGQAGPPEGTPDGLPFVIHHYNLTQSGIHQIQNMKLDELARDRVWTSCTIILPLRSQGNSGSPVRPVAIGVSHKDMQ